MKIYTSYFAMMRHTPKEIVPVSISLYSPPGYEGLSMTTLAPAKDILFEYKKNPDTEKYTKAYMKQLSMLTPEAVYNVLHKLTNGKDCVLLCYEKTGSFCHRNLVAQWMNGSGYSVVEWTK